MKLRVKNKAPDFSLPDQNNTVHTLSDYKGTWVLLYFYPKDDTPGCTKEACGVRKNLPRFKKMKAEVLGISADSVESHKKFAKKYQLQFPLLADEEKKALKAYGVWAKKKFMGREYFGILRTSFLIDPDGAIAKIYTNVKPPEHAEEVLQDLHALQKHKEFQDTTKTKLRVHF